MTSSSVNSDNRPGLRPRKMSAKYFSFKWKTDSGESTSVKNSEHLKSSDEVDTARIGFFKSFKKKLSIKNFCKSKRKVG